MITSQEAADSLVQMTPLVCREINQFCRNTFETRGSGRLGSGMGTLLEALWGYYANRSLKTWESGPVACEIAWLPDNEYHDFACVHRSEEWQHENKMGELLRIEAKPMNTKADESKAHFDELAHNLGEYDLLLVLAWSWKKLDEYLVYPCIQDQFIGSSKDVALLRDKLHLSRGGFFVDRASCPDGCLPDACSHHGEPLNYKGNRERRKGPESCRGSQKTPQSANFGGLVRMLGTKGKEAGNASREVQAANTVAGEYIAFVKRNFSGRVKPDQ